MDIHVDIRGFSEIHVWICYRFSEIHVRICYGFSDQGILKQDLSEKKRGLTRMSEICNSSLRVRNYCVVCNCFRR